MIRYNLIELGKFSVATLCTAHWMACLWGVVGRSVCAAATAEGCEALSPAYPYLPSYREHSWIQKASMTDATPLELYGASLYVALANIFGGTSDISPASYLELYTQCAMMFLGSALWAYIIGCGCGIVATLNPTLVEQRRRLDELNYFCERAAPCGCRRSVACAPRVTAAAAPDEHHA